MDVALGDVREHDGEPRAVSVHLRRGVGLEPGARTGVGFPQVAGRDVHQVDREAQRRLLDIDLVVEIQPEGQRHLVEQQVLGGQVALFRNAVEGRVVAVHALVQALEDVGHGADMDHVGLLAVPLGEGVHGVQEPGGVDAAALAGVQRVFDDVQACEVFLDEIGVPADLVAVVEVFDEVVVELDAQRPQRQEDHGCQHAPEQAPAPADDKVGQPVAVAVLAALGGGPDPHREHGHEGRQKEHRVDPGGGHADGHDVAQVAEGRDVGKVHRKEAHGRGQAGQENRLHVDAQRLHHRRMP